MGFSNASFMAFYIIGLEAASSLSLAVFYLFMEVPVTSEVIEALAAYNLRLSFMIALCSIFFFHFSCLSFFSALFLAFSFFFCAFLISLSLLFLSFSSA